MKTLAVLAFCAASVCAISQPARLLKVDVKVGAVFRYHLTTDMSTPDGKGKMGFVANFTEKLVARKGDEFTWEQKFSVPSTYATGAAKGGDAGFKMLDNMQMRLISDAQGQSKRIEIAGQVVNSTGTPNVTFSAKPVKPGDKWKAIVATGANKVPIEYRLARYMVQGGKTLAVIEGWYKAPQLVKQTTPVEFRVDVATGKMVRASADMLLTNQGQKLRLKYLLTLTP
jgi:hypothetical protein